MIGMARRWPTIITDFIRMKPGMDDIDDIKKELDVSQAEATVLKTKNRLYTEWKTMFLPVIKERYARMKALMDSRKKSIDEYRNWLKPYVSKFKAMKELDEKNAAAWVSDAYVTPGFGQTEGLGGTRLWVFKSFEIVEGGKPSYVLDKRYADTGWQVVPYDNWVKKWKMKIEYKYKMRISDKDVETVTKEALSEKGAQMENRQMNPEDLYYILFDMQFLLSLLKTPPPEGIESDNLMIFPLRTWVMSQNAMLLHLIEMKAREKFIENEINKIIGSSSIEEDNLKKVETEFEEKKEEERFAGLKDSLYSLNQRGRKLRKHLTRVAHIFIRPGPYESVFFERVSKMYFRATGQSYGQMVDWFKAQWHVE
jgi:hypothetical protein